MAWTDRILTATYISPTGGIFLFQYENVSVESDKKTAVFTFPEIDGAFIQDLGRAGRRFPFVLFFSGEDYDIVSDSFLRALEEKGIGTLIHPLYGVKSVVPTGTFTRRDDLLTGANQAAFNVTFSETLTGLTFPASIENVVNIIKDAITAYQTAMSFQFSDVLNVITASEEIAIEQTFEAQRGIIDLQFESIVKTSDELNASFQTVNNSLREQIANIKDIPDIVSSQLITLIRIPSESTKKLSEKITAYNTVIDVELSKDVYESNNYNNEPANSFISNMVQVYSSLVAVCDSVLIENFNTRNEAISVSEQILNKFDEIKLWLDNNLTSLGLVDTGEAYESFLNVLSLTTSYLIDLSFDLPSERFRILGEETNIIPLVSELYGDLEQLDFFIITNNLTCDEIEILPQGKEVVYYV